VELRCNVALSSTQLLALQCSFERCSAELFAKLRSSKLFVELL
jgi:hypothetical protein